MLKSHEKFHSANGKRQILAADDEMINREILGEIFRSDYEVIFAVDGAETIEKMREYRETLSLVILDIRMPVMSGLEVLKAVRDDETLSRIPIIVATAETETEIESLKLGAIDFIPKPYPNVGVIQARVQRVIELSEDRDIIQSTERDELTGLYNREFFFRYAQQFDQFHREQTMDAVLVDVNHFHMINERYGKACGDSVLRGMAECVRDLVKDGGGIVGRRGADTFLIYCPHREDYREIMEKASMQQLDGENEDLRVHLRMGIYPNVDKGIDIERRFDRAKMAADTVKGSFTQNIAYYDDHLHEQQLFAERLIEDFPAAIRERQFKVYYQPKFDVRPDVPILASCEALVRWVHPELGMISPGMFIPLFEKNGLIQTLDFCVWRETARQIRDWKDRFGYSIPVSVNVSRIDMYDPALPATLKEILDAEGLTSEDFLLEVTESAYTQDSRQIVDTVESLQHMGFKIEMDDFGTGYSSLNMISSLPIDALKLDMQFIREAFKDGGTTHMVEVIISIANYLSVPVIAEGVETETQLLALKTLGVDLVQGYFFSKPVPAKEFEPFILQRKEADAAAAERLLEEERIRHRKGMRELERIQNGEADAGAGEESGTGLDTDDAGGTPASGHADGVDYWAGRRGTAAAEDGSTETDVRGDGTGNAAGSADGAAGGAAGRRSEKLDILRRESRKITSRTEADSITGKEHMGIQLRTASIFFVVLALIAATALLMTDLMVGRGYQRMQKASDHHIAAQLAASDMESGSDYLTDRVRCFVVTGEIHYLKDFFEEVEVTRRRDNAVNHLGELLEGSDSGALDSLNTALDLSNELIGVENYAMRLMAEAGEYSEGDIPDIILEIPLQKEDKNLSPEQLREKAQVLVFDNSYMHYKDKIRENVSLCTQALIRSSSQELEKSSARLAVLVNIQTVISVLFLLIVLALVVLITQMVRKPLTNMVRKMQNHEIIPPTGVEELRFVTRTYNVILKENQDAQERLRHEASHDKLTGLFNRGAYELLMESADTEHMALLLVDVDFFKTVNDTYGHAVGDRVLKRVAEILRVNFRSVDILCRIGGDEFAVVMTRVNSSMAQLVYNKIQRANDMLQHPKDDLPPVSLSVGVAFSDRKNPQGDIFKDADTALYRVKEAGRKGCVIYE